MIVDEVHAVAGTKRGAHLALSLERLDALLPKPAQRIGLSATVRPVDEVSGFLGGGRPVAVVQPGTPKTVEISVQVPVEDMASMLTQSEEDPERTQNSIWPAVEQRVLELIRQQRSTIVFANSRRLAERLTARLNELAGEARELERFPAEAIGQSGFTTGAEPVVARAHHGSMSREQRTGGGGGAQVRAAAVRGGDVVVGARHRHGRGRPGGADRGAADGRVGDAARRARRAPRGRGVAGRDVPEVPGRPGVVRGGGRADGGRRHRVGALPAQPARRAGPAHRRDDRAGAVDRGRAGDAGAAGRRRTPRCRSPRCTRCWTCWPGAIPARSSASCGRASRGTGSTASCRGGLERSGWPSPPAAPSRTGACSP